MNKQCVKCQQVKDLEEFRSDKRMPNGRGNICTGCNRARKLAWEHANRDELRAKRRSRNHRYTARKQAYSIANRDRGREYEKKYQQANRDAIKARQRRWRLNKYRANPQRQALKSNEWRKKNRERVMARRRELYQKNQERIREQYIRRLSLQRGAAISDFTEMQWRELKMAYGQRCAYCGKRTERLERDHVIPLTRGGNHTASNIVPACKSCNSRKGNRTLDEIGMRIILVIE